MITDGAVSGFFDSAFRTAYDGGSIEEVGEAAVMGCVSCGAVAWFLGGSIKVFGRGIQKVFGKNNVEIDANGNRVRVNDDGTVVRIDENGNDIPASVTDAEIHIPKGVLASDIEPWKSKLTFGKANIFGHKPLYFEGKKVASKKSELVKQLSDLGYDMKADSGHDYVIRKLVKNLKSKEDVQKASILFMNGDKHYLIRDLIQDNVLESLDDALIAGMLLKQGYYGYGSKGCKATVTRIKENSLLYELFEKGLPKVNNIGKTWLVNETYSLIEVAPFIKTKEQQQAVLQLLESTKEHRFAYKRDLIAKTVEKYIKSEKDIDNYVKFINTWHGYDLDYYNYLKSSDEDVVDSVYQLLAKETQIKPLKDLISVSQGDVNALKAALILKQNNVSDFLLEDFILAAKDDFGNYDLEKINSFLISDNIVDIALNAIDKGGNFTAQFAGF